MDRFDDIRDYLTGLQDRICTAIETADGELADVLGNFVSRVSSSPSARTPTSSEAGSTHSSRRWALPPL